MLARAWTRWHRCYDEGVTHWREPEEILQLHLTISTPNGMQPDEGLSGATNRSRGRDWHLSSVSTRRGELWPTDANVHASLGTQRPPWQAPGASHGSFGSVSPATPTGVTTLTLFVGRLGGFDQGTWTASRQQGLGLDARLEPSRVISAQSSSETPANGSPNLPGKGGTHGQCYFHHPRAFGDGGLGAFGPLRRTAPDKHGTPGREIEALRCGKMHLITTSHAVLGVTAHVFRSGPGEAIPG
jgi:hypothetical protein